MIHLQKTIIFSWLIILFGFIPVFSQDYEQIVSISDKKNAKIKVHKGEMGQDSFKVQILVEWVNEDLMPEKDKKSVIVLERSKLNLKPRGKISCLQLNDTTPDYLCVHDTAFLTFIVHEDLGGDKVEIALPFVYAKCADKAEKFKHRSEFFFRQPKELVVEYLTPKLEIQYTRFEEENDNEKVDANEKISLHFKLKNTGDSPSEGLKLRLSDKNKMPGMIFEANQYIKKIESGESFNINYDIQANLDVNTGISVFKLSATDKNGFTVQSEDISINVQALSPPSIIWTNPVEQTSLVNMAEFEISANIFSSVDIDEMLVYINDSIVPDDRGFKELKESTLLHYKKILKLPGGMNFIKIEAKNRAGSSISSVRTINYNPDADLEKRLALIIGNSNYRSVGTLKNTLNDARDMAKALKDMDFEVLLYEDLKNKDETTGAILDFGSKLHSYNIALFFYAGHGIQVQGENYIIPVEAELNSPEVVRSYCVNVDDVLAEMEGSNNKANIVILDACRDNPFEKSWSRSTKSSGLAFMAAPDGTFIAYSTSPGSVASDGTGRNGIYTGELLKYIQTPNIKIEEVFKRVGATVKHVSDKKQTPWVTSSFTGNFYFKKDK